MALERQGLLKIERVKGGLVKFQKSEYKECVVIGMAMDYNLTLPETVKQAAKAVKAKALEEGALEFATKADGTYVLSPQP